MAIAIRIHSAKPPVNFDYQRQSCRDIRITIEQPEDRPLSKSIKEAGVVISVRRMGMLMTRRSNKPVVSHNNS